MFPFDLGHTSYLLNGFSIFQLQCLSSSLSLSQTLFHLHLLSILKSGFVLGFFWVFVILEEREAAAAACTGAQPLWLYYWRHIIIIIFFRSCLKKQREKKIYKK